MQFIWNDLVDRARLYVDDDHQTEDSWIALDRWMTLFQVEYAALFRKWLRTGLVGPAYTEQAFTGNSVTISGVAAVIGVAEDLGYTKRVLHSAQSQFGRVPFWTGTDDVGKSISWEASGAADTVTITLHPNDADGKYLVRYIAYPAYVTDRTTTVDLPYSGDERLVLGAAKRANVKGSTRSAGLEDLIRDADAELNFAAFAKINGDSPRVRRLAPHRGRFSSDRFGAGGFPANPAFWFYP